VKYPNFYYKTDSSLPTSGRQVVQSDSNRIIQKSLIINVTLHIPPELSLNIIILRLPKTKMILI